MSCPMNTYRKYFSEEYRFYYLGSIGVNVHILYIRACDWIQLSTRFCCYVWDNFFFMANWIYFHAIVQFKDLEGNGLISPWHPIFPLRFYLWRWWVVLYHRNLHCGYNRMNSVFPAITKINATEAHMFEHYMIQVCPNYCKMSNECRVEKFF